MVDCLNVCITGLPDEVWAHLEEGGAREKFFIEAHAYLEQQRSSHWWCEMGIITAVRYTASGTPARPARPPCPARLPSLLVPEPRLLSSQEFVVLFEWTEEISVLELRRELGPLSSPSS